jgi:WD40 repeat protein
MSQAPTHVGLGHLPRECEVMIMAFLEGRDLWALVSSSKHWRKLSEELSVWEKCYEKRYGRSVPPHLRACSWIERYLQRKRYEKNWSTKNFIPQCIFKKGTQWWTPLTVCPISSVKLQGNVMVSGSIDKVVKIWDVDKVTCSNTLFGHDGPVRCVQFDDEKIISGSDDHNIKYWRLNTGRCFKTLEGHTERVCALRFSPEILVTASQDLTIRVWDVANGDHIATLTGHSGSIWCLDFTNGTLVTGSADQTVRVWDLETTKCLGSISGHSASIASLQYDESLNMLLTASLDKYVKAWDLRQMPRTCMRAFIGHDGPVGCLQFDACKVLTGSSDENVKVWDLGSGKCLSTLPQQSAVACLHFVDHRLAVGTRSTLTVSDYNHYTSS